MTYPTNRPSRLGTPAQRAWVLTVALLWTLTWLAPIAAIHLVTTRPSPSVGVGFFGLACVVTVVFGARTSRHAGRGGAGRHLAHSALLGTVALWAWSWSLLLVVGTAWTLGGGGSPGGLVLGAAVIFVIGLGVSLLAALVCFLILLALLGLGHGVALLARGTGARPRCDGHRRLTA